MRPATLERPGIMPSSGPVVGYQVQTDAGGVGQVLGSRMVPPIIGGAVALSAELGGRVLAGDARASLDVPVGALEQDTILTISSLASAPAPPAGMVVLAAVQVSPLGMRFRQPVGVEFPVLNVARLPEGCEAEADKGYQGLAEQVTLVTVRNAETGEEQPVPRLTVYTPIKKPKGQELTDEQKAFNRQLGTIRVRVEHCIGWVKNWAIIAARFRCAHSIYTLVMQVVCGLVNWQTQRWQTAQAAEAT